jgi:Flp pilus assembly pilin Flp
MNPMISLYVISSNFVADRRERMKSQYGDRGASMIEYGALLILISAIIAALIASDIDGIIGKKVKELVNQIFQGGQAK